MSLRRSRPSSPPSAASDSGALKGQRPKIGITASPKREPAYYDTFKRAVETAGGEAVVLTSGSDSLPDVDGLLLPGGWDVDPALYGEEADKTVGPIDRELDDTEVKLFHEARKSQIPVLGICRGQQVINVAMGGSLFQHLEDHDVRVHGRRHLAHTIEVDPESELGRAAGETSIRVNSLHHQAVRSLAPGLHQTAHGQDGTVEGLESDDGLIVAVQCHPEELTGDLPWARSLFERFVARARSHRRTPKA
ncbi:MAG TPA: gamma-glutamyl-gamma-aminobutyrate hydrolase family protein [Candidatus Dormibacteraeota bacterium]|nr:gamma-glutamyl-gamma-aminobutyrate hydrolase family protein [Candidatus Dormibacteraeota bacterium]